MLAKVVKKQAAVRVSPFSFPQIGEAKFQTKGVDGFVVPEVLEFSPAENAENEPEIAPPFEDVQQTAREEAARIIAQAEADREMIEQAAYERAVQKARETIDLEVQAKADELRAQLAETIEQISVLSNEIAERSEIELVELALEIARKIVGREVTIDREVALTLVKISLAKLHNRTFAKVHLHPQDFAYLEAHRERVNFHGSLELVEDRSISPGGCLVHTETGDIDARIESQFDEIAHGLLGGMRDKG